jgi:Uma2 family endonuclease
MESVSEKIGMPLDEFIQLYAEQPFEFISGERIVRMANVVGHTEIIEILFLSIYMFASNRQLGHIVRETPFVLSYPSNWVTGSRTPDLMYFLMERLTAYKEADPEYRKKPYVIVPDLAVEVLSPTDNRLDMQDKVDLYLLDGVRLVWVIDPDKLKVATYVMQSRQPFTKQQTNLTPEDTLTGGEVIPGFEIKVASLFE